MLYGNVPKVIDLLDIVYYYNSIKLNEHYF